MTETLDPASAILTWISDTSVPCITLDEAGRINGIRSFDRVPMGIGIVTVTEDGYAPLLCEGEIALYDEQWLGRNALCEGLYCIEYQSTQSGLPRRDFAERFAADDDTARLLICRRVVELRRYPRNPTQWITLPLARTGPDEEARTFVCIDGPYEDYHILSKLAGRVIGVYRPAPVAMDR
ncbi:MAG TPA: hypothetical protein VLG14_14325 [Sphingomonas sp.]|nr:hypothetical protein [Sphingomonas sp.]